MIIIFIFYGLPSFIQNLSCIHYSHRSSAFRLIHTVPKGDILPLKSTEISKDETSSFALLRRSWWVVDQLRAKPEGFGSSTRGRRFVSDFEKKSPICLTSHLDHLGFFDAHNYNCWFMLLFLFCFMLFIGNKNPQDLYWVKRQNQHNGPTTAFGGGRFGVDQNAPWKKHQNAGFGRKIVHTHWSSHGTPVVNYSPDFSISGRVF